MSALPSQIDRYTVIARLGRGGMGVVYEVRDPEFPRRLALKLLNARRAKADGLERFAREANAMAKVRHPGIVAIHSVGRANEGPFIVTDLVEGRDLRRCIDDGPLEPREACRIVAQLSHAVAALHAAGVVHRDLKPGNVILTPEGQPVLLDFGLAREEDAESLTESGAVMGTPAYMSPEQAMGFKREHGPRSDVYGLGGVLYALLAGRAPYEGHLVQVINAILKYPPEWPPGLDPALRAILERCLAKHPDERYGTAAEVGGELERFLSGVTTEAARAATKKRVRSAAMGVLGAGALIVLLLGASWALDSPPPEEATTTETPEPPAPEGLSEEELHGAERELRDLRRHDDDPRAQYEAAGRWLGAYAEAPQAEEVRALRERASRGFPHPVLAGVSAGVVLGDDAVLTWNQPEAPHSSVLELWSLPSGEKVRGWKLGWPVVAAAPTKDAVLVAGRAGQLARVERASSQVTRRFDSPLPQIHTLAVSPDGERLAVGGRLAEGSPALWILDAGTGERTLNLDVRFTAVRALRFSPDGAVLVATGGTPLNEGGLDQLGEGSGVTVFGRDGALRWHEPLVSAGECLAFAPSGDVFAVGTSAGAIHLCSVSERRQRTFRGPEGEGLMQAAAHTGWVRGLAFAPDGQSLHSVAAGPGQTKHGFLARWSLAGERLANRRLEGKVCGLSQSANGKLLFVPTFETGAQVWRPD